MRIIHKNRHSAVPFHCRCHHAAIAGVSTDVGVKERRLAAIAAYRLRHSLARFVLDIGNEDFGALRRKAPRNRAADIIGGAGDDGYVFLKSHTA